MNWIKAGVAAAMLTIPFQAGAAEPASADLLQIATNLGQQYDSNYRTKDADAMASLYAPDAILVSPGGAIVRGHDALLAYYRKRFSSGASDHHIHVLEAHAQGNGGYALGDFSVRSPSRSGQVREEKGHILIVCRHDPDGWHLALVQPSIPAQD